MKRVRELWDNVKCTNIRITGVPEGEKREKGTNINNMMQILNAPNLRQLVRLANDLGITKEEVVTIQQSQGQFYLVYYSKE